MNDTPTVSEKGLVVKRGIGMANRWNAGAFPAVHQLAGSKKPARQTGSDGPEIGWVF